MIARYDWLTERRPRVDQATPEHDHHFEPRVEDDALIRGRGRFVEDAPQPNQAYAVFVRSPHAHARIRTIDVARPGGMTADQRRPAWIRQLSSTIIISSRVSRMMRSFEM